MKINLSHGNGGMETAQLIDKIFMRHFRNDLNKGMEDAALLNVGGNIAFTTDSFVVKPVFFKGGDIGRLAVCGTVNDLSTTGAIPKFFSIAFIIEEGFDTDDLDRIARSVQETAEEAGVRIVTGDTKVIEGSGGVYINTAGIGSIKNKAVSFKDASVEDAIIVSGSLGDHHACILSHRLGIENDICSDVSPLNGMIQAMLEEGITPHGMRDITRGGLATQLNEIAKAGPFKIEIDEVSLPVLEEVRGFSDILGLDPLYMGNEGKMLIVVPKGEAVRAVDVLRATKYGKNAAVIGRIKQGSGVVLNTKLSGKRILGPLTGEGLPRIC